MTRFSRRKALKAFGLTIGSTTLSQIPLLKAAALPSFDFSTYAQQSHTALLIGGGKRGKHFGAFALRTPGQLRLAGVAEPQPERCQAIAQQHLLPAEQCFDHWKAAFKADRFAKVALLATSGNYVAPCIAALRAGYDVWTDKPISLDKVEEADVLALAKRLGRHIVFCYIQDKELRLQAYSPVKRSPVAPLV